MPMRFGVIGHRGARGLFPENTIEGIERTLSVGVRAIELDVALTADGVPIVVHDPSPNPDIVRSGGRWLERPGEPFHHRAWHTLDRLDVGRLRPGCALTAAFADQESIDGARIPTLGAALAAVVAGKATCWIELKSVPSSLGADRTASPEALVAATLSVVDRLTARGSVVLQSFDWRCQRLIRAMAPDVPLAWLTREAARDEWPAWFDGAAADDALTGVAAVGGRVWAPEYVDLTAERVARAHHLGVAVVPWTVNDVAAINRLIGWGVDGLISDRPDQALAISRATS